MAKKLSKLAAPVRLEQDYQKKIRKIIIRIGQAIKDIVIPNLETLVNEANAKRPTNDSSIRLDQNIGEKIQELFNATRTFTGEEFDDFILNNLTQAEAEAINNWNRTQVHRLIRQGLGVDLFIGEPWLFEQMNIFAINNVNLIKNVSNSFIDQAEQIVIDGVRNGTRHEAIAKQILGVGKDELGRVSRFKQAKTRANLIGRDQVNKMNGELTKLRQESIGVKKYIWRTVGDGRVRSSHAARNGVEYNWSEGSPVGTHPGQEINCRCYAEPVLDDLLK